MRSTSSTRFTRRTILAGSAAVAGTALTRSLAPVFAAVSPAALAADPRRPQYHLLPPANWLNDPNGPIFRRGEYHMFYQYTLDPAGSGPKLWGHAVSPDMVHWRHLPVALAPTPNGPDAGGCWTGSALPNGDRVAFLYTGVVPAPENEATIRDGAHSLRESVCLAFASGNLTHWTKEAAPVIAAPPPGLDVTGFRDPCPWRDGDHWYLALGSGIRGRGGAVLLYRASGLRHWDYLHPLLQGSESASNNTDPVAAGDMWECPDFFPLGDRHVLIHSTGGKALWQTGVLDRASMTFHPERGGVLDAGSFYAPKTQLDAHGNRILWGWITESRSESEYRAAGWAGVMSLPRVLTLDADHNLRIAVAPAVDMLSLEEEHLRIATDEAATRRQLSGMTLPGACGRIICSFRRDSGPFEISFVSLGPDQQTLLTSRFDPARPSEITTIENRPSESFCAEQPVPLGPGTSEAELRFCIDGSVVECFTNGYGALTTRFYDRSSAAPAIGVQIGAGLRALTALSMAQFAPISPNRLTT